jgi:hypothetical protein
MLPAQLRQQKLGKFKNIIATVAQGRKVRTKQIQTVQ